MYPIDMQIAPAQSPRDRLSVALRIFYLIPHIIVLYLYQLAAGVVMLVHWFVIVFTGKRNESMQDFTARYLSYLASVTAYGSLLHDQFPPFGRVDPGGPISVSVPGAGGDANRLTVALRLFIVIPAGIISAVLSFAAQFVAIVSWFQIVFTGQQSEGMRDFIARVIRYSIQVQGYSALLTDEYPWPSATGFSG